MSTDALTIDADKLQDPDNASGKIETRRIDESHLRPERDGVVSPEPEGDSAADHFAAGIRQPSAVRGSTSLSQLFRDLIELTKPRIVVMILITTMATALIGAGQAVELIQLVWLLVGTGLVAASAGAANQVWERSIDQRMTRTASRPVAIGRFSVGPACLYTVVMGSLGCYLLYDHFHAIPAMVGAATWLLYVLVYTPMKTRTSWNTTVGAVAGAIPVLIGYTATGGSLLDVTGWLLVGILVAWQYPHFMAIAWIYRKQYAEAGFQMSTTVDPTGRNAGLQSILGSCLLIGCSLALCWIPPVSLGNLAASAAVVLVSWPMLRTSFAFSGKPDDLVARQLLRKSLLVLPLVLAIVTIRLFW